MIAPLVRAARLMNASIFIALSISSASMAAETPKTASRLTDIIALVRERGWPGDLARFCRALGLNVVGSQCLAQQVAFSAEGHQRAFNLIPLEPGTVSYVVIVDLAADQGVIYLASGSGELISTSTVSSGAANTRISIDEAQLRFQKELAFWATNVEQFDKWLQHRNYGPLK
jgi:hypothetical protein